jgi:hypothetical protein
MQKEYSFATVLCVPKLVGLLDSHLGKLPEGSKTGRCRAEIDSNRSNGFQERSLRQIAGTRTIFHLRQSGAMLEP